MTPTPAGTSLNAMLAGQSIADCGDPIALMEALHAAYKTQLSEELRAVRADVARAATKADNLSKAIRLVENSFEFDSPVDNSARIRTDAIPTVKQLLADYNVAAPFLTAEYRAMDIWVASDGSVQTFATSVTESELAAVRASAPLLETGTELVTAYWDMVELPYETRKLDDPPVLRKVYTSSLESRITNADYSLMTDALYASLPSLVVQIQDGELRIKALIDEINAQPQDDGKRFRDARRQEAKGMDDRLAEQRQAVDAGSRKLASLIDNTRRGSDNRGA